MALVLLSLLFFYLSPSVSKNTPTEPNQWNIERQLGTATFTLDLQYYCSSPLAALEEELNSMW